MDGGLFLHWVDGLFPCFCHSPIPEAVKRNQPTTQLASAPCLRSFFPRVPVDGQLLSKKQHWHLLDWQKEEAAPKPLGDCSSGVVVLVNA